MDHELSHPGGELVEELEERSLVVRRMHERQAAKLPYQADIIPSVTARSHAPRRAETYLFDRHSGFVRHPDCVDAGLPRGGHDPAPDPWEDVDVAMAVDVRDRDARRLETGELRRAFDRHVLWPDLPAQGTPDETGQRIEGPPLGARIPQARHGLARCDRRPHGEVYVQTDAESRGAVCASDRIAKAGRVRDERRRRDAAHFMRFDDAAIYSRRESKVIRIDHESPLSDNAPAGRSSGSARGRPTS